MSSELSPERSELAGAAEGGAGQFAESEDLEPVFTAEDAGWARDFFARQGKFSQEYFVYCKKI